MEFLIGLLGAFAAAADEHALPGSAGGGLDGVGIESVERHQLRAGDVDLPVLGGRADIDEGNGFAGLDFGVKLCGLNFHWRELQNNHITT